jgi:predicted DNA-binding protein
MFTSYTEVALVCEHLVSKHRVMAENTTHVSEARPATVVARVSAEERQRISDLARRGDRTPSREIRRAIRFYLAHYEEADRALREPRHQRPRRTPKGAVTHEQRA